MHLKSKIHSLRAKLFVLVFFSIMVVAVPLISIAYKDLQKVSSEFEIDVFNNTIYLLDDNIQARYLNMLSDQVLEVFERKYDLQNIALLTKASLESMRSLDEEHKQQMLERWVKSLLFLDYYSAIIKEGELLVPSFFFEMLLQDKNRKDFKEELLLQKTDPSHAYKEGHYAVFFLTEEDKVFAKPHEEALEHFGVQELFAEAEKIGKRASVLIYFLPLSDGTVIATATLLNDIDSQFLRAEQSIINAMQEKFDSLEFYENSVFALISGTGELLANKGALTALEAAHLPKSALLAAKKNHRSEFIYSSDSDFSETLQSTEFLENFGDGVFRLTYFKALDWYILTAAPYSAIKEDSNQLLYHLFLLSAVTIFLCLVGTVFMAFRLIKPLRILTRKANEFANMDLMEEMHSAMQGDHARSFAELTQDLPVNRLDEVGQLATSFSNMGKALDENIHNLIVSRAAQDRMQGELNAARDIQMSILPSVTDAPRFTNYRADAFLEPAKEVGGDLYDYFLMEDGRHVVVIGDVSGKGTAAALFMSMTVTLVRYTLLNGLAPHKAMEQVNSMLCRNNATCMFVTLFIGILDPKTGTLEFANGGHCHPYIIRSDYTEVKILTHMSGAVVGIFEDLPYSLGTMVMEEGELCLLYSDGISEAMNNERKVYSEARIQTCMVENRNKNTAELIACIYEDILLHRADAAPSDDITMLCFQYQPI